VSPDDRGAPCFQGFELKPHHSATCDRRAHLETAPMRRNVGYPHREPLRSPWTQMGRHRSGVPRSLARDGSL
jgi:hypothetical protein